MLSFGLMKVDYIDNIIRSLAESRTFESPLETVECTNITRSVSVRFMLEKRFYTTTFSFSWRECFQSYLEQLESIYT